MVLWVWPTFRFSSELSSHGIKLIREAGAAFQKSSRRASFDPVTDKMAESAKTAGDAAYASKNWAEAITQYSACIDAASAAGADKEFLMKVYSNRSAVYAAQKTYSSALLDGDKCVQLDSEWAKGYVRRGDALFGLRRWTDAANAYNRANALAPGQGYEGKADKAIEARSGDEERARQYAQRQAYNASGGTSTIMPTLPNSGMLAQVYNMAQKGLFAFFFLYALPLQWIPFLGSVVPSSGLLYRLMLGCAFVVHLLHMYCSAGRPKLSMSYLQAVLPLQGIHCLFLVVALFASRPYLLAATPLLLNQLVMCLPALIAILRPSMAGAKSALPAQFAQYAGQLDQLDRAMGTPEGVQMLRTNFNNIACSAEVMQGVYLVFELLMPTRNFILLYLWWQYLMMRFLMDKTGGMKSAFLVLDGQISSVTNHRMCPAIVGKGYGFVRSFMINQIESSKTQAEERATGGGGGGFMNTVKSAAGKCTIS